MSTATSYCCLLALLGAAAGSLTPTEPMRADDGPPMRPSGNYSTALGCTCDGECAASATQGSAPFYQCDWCWTKGKCGTSGVRGYWDYCAYKPMQTFDGQGYTDKVEQVWGALTAADVAGKSAPAVGVSTMLKNMMTESMITTFDDQWEVLPSGRSKAIHVQGVVCQFDLEVLPNTGFTGLFAPGSQRGMVRMGNAMTLEPGSAPLPHDTPMFPGLGFKFLRSSMHSAGFVALRASGPGGSWNFFDSDFANHVAPDPVFLKLHKFQQASGCIDMVGLSDVCMYSQDGAKVAKPAFPFKLLFSPGNVSTPNKKKTNKEELDELSSIPVGTHLFDVYAFASPKDEQVANKTFLGKITTSSQCVKSLFGDQQLFIRHQRMEEDFALRPDWITQVKDTACAATPGPVSKWQCGASSGRVPESAPSDLVV